MAGLGPAIHDNPQACALAFVDARPKAEDDDLHLLIRSS
jgi:hypothetical protein